MAIDTSIKSPADVANNALTRMGFKMRVGSLLDGSDHAQHILDVYGQTRDALMESYDYDFAEWQVNLALLKSAPAKGYFPPDAPYTPTTWPLAGFLYEYAYPDDAIKIRSVRFQPQFAINFRPRHNPFTEGNDPTLTPPQRVILCNVPNALCVYTRRVTDPTTWDVSFSEALASKLALLLGPALVGLQAAQLTAAEATSADMESKVGMR